MTIDEIFEKCKSITLSKREDYTSNPEFDPHENFKRSALVSSWFKKDEDKAYVILIATKLARLGSLLSKDSEPNNESVEDSFLDLINYCALWMESKGKSTYTYKVEHYPKVNFDELKFNLTKCFFCDGLLLNSDSVKASLSGKFAHAYCENGSTNEELKRRFNS